MKEKADSLQKGDQSLFEKNFRPHVIETERSKKWTLENFSSGNRSASPPAKKPFRTGPSPNFYLLPRSNFPSPKNPHSEKIPYISRAIKTNFLIFLVLKDKNSCFFPRSTPHGVSFFTFFSVLFTFLGCFHFSPFSEFHYWPFSGDFIFQLFQFFCECCGFEKPFFTLSRFLPYTPSHICHSVASATNLRELFLLSCVFYFTLLTKIWHNLLLSRLPWSRQFFLEGCRTSH